jgi:ankyrin repeat protein
LQAFGKWLHDRIEDDENTTLLEQIDDHGWTLFHFACNSCALEEAFCLLEAGSDIDACTADNTTGLHMLGKAQQQQRQPLPVYNQLLHVMVTKGASVNQAKKSGETPVHVCAMRGNEVALAGQSSAKE